MFGLYTYRPAPFDWPTSSWWENIRDVQSETLFKFLEQDLNNTLNSCNARAHRMSFALLGAVSVKMTEDYGLKTWQLVIQRSNV